MVPPPPTIPHALRTPKATAPFRLVRHWDRDELMSMAGSIDTGFDIAAFATAMRQLDRYRNEDIPIAAAELPELRSYFHAWVDDLASAGRSGHQRSREDS
jgi:hypothetical protein